MAISDSIARTLRRLMVGIRGAEGAEWIPRVFDGLSKEFGRLNVYRRKVLSAMVPNDNTDPDAYDDLEEKYGIDNYLAVSEEERLDRIIEAAQQNGNGGPDFLQDALQQAGFPLYVLTNTKIDSSGIQYGGSIQYGGGVQYGLGVSRTNPASIAGTLITSTIPTEGGRPYAVQYGGSTQYGGSVQYGTLDPLKMNPIPRTPTIPTSPVRWGRFLILSPYEDRFAVDGELLNLTAEEWRFFKRLVIKTKYTRDWCIAQIEVAS